MKNKKTKVIILIIIAICALIITGVIVVINVLNSTRALNKDRMMADGSYQIRFSDLVDWNDLKGYNNKTVTAIGYLSPITSYDGSFAYLMNLPYQTCPYCVPSDTKITNTISIFAKKGKKINFTEAAVMIKGTLKLEPYTDKYGYSYDYRIVDVTITEADTTGLGDKITLYNKLAEKQIISNIMEVLYAVDNNVFYDEYTSYGEVYNRAIVDSINLEVTIKQLDDFDNNDVAILKEVATKLKDITTETNNLLREEKYAEIMGYKERVLELFYKMNDWMAEHEL